MLYGALLEHPHHFTTQEMTEIMHSLQYSSRGVIGWDAPRPIFLPDAIERAVPLFQQMLQKASPFQKVSFAVRSYSGHTSGDMFLMDGHLHWRFDQIDSTAHFDAYPSPVEFESETEIIPNWIIRPNGEDQRYEYHDALFGLRYAVKNSVTIRIGNAIQNAESTITELSFTERLTQLRDLFMRGLIADVEYQRTVDRLVHEAETVEATPQDRLRMLMDLHEHGFISTQELARKRQRVLDRL